MRKLSLLHDDIQRSLHVLDVLKAIFEEMGRRRVEESCDCWLQRKATVPSGSAVQKYRKELQIFKDREKGYPKATMTVKQAFKLYAKVLGEVETVLREKGLRKNHTKARNKELNDKFEKAENTPGALERFEYLVERDLENISRELQEFRLKQRKFDEDHGLLPINTP